MQVGRDELNDGWCALYATTSEGLSFTGWWRRFGPFILTYVSTYSTLPPLSLIDPPPLHDAVPSHSWMASPGPGG